MKKCIAAIDMGTNSFHLIIVELKKDGNFKIIDREREVIRLGSQSGKGFSMIVEDEMEKAINILKGYEKIAAFYNAEIRAIATSAVREAKNKDEFIDRVFEETGITVEAIDGKWEAELIYLGVQHALEVKKKRVLVWILAEEAPNSLLVKKGNRNFLKALK
jgi:exopolyphosphatase/guanosine-5'-triphosphate,3'-diphosphate pyrophosphatase